MELASISKFLSYVLRHQPESIGLELDSEGWASIDQLLDCARKAGHKLDLDVLKKVVETNDKKRFSISSDLLRIRAVQGHSTAEVNISYPEQVPPTDLFHGTATRFMESIRAKGLSPGSRHYVHLSQDRETAEKVGRRHGVPAVLTIAAVQMAMQGFKFHQADNGVWLTREVPTAFIIGL